MLRLKILFEDFFYISNSLDALLPVNKYNLERLFINLVLRRLMGSVSALVIFGQ